MCVSGFFEAQLSEALKRRKDVARNPGVGEGAQPQPFARNERSRFRRFSEGEPFIFRPALRVSGRPEYARMSSLSQEAFLRE